MADPTVRGRVLDAIRQNPGIGPRGLADLLAMHTTNVHDAVQQLKVAGAIVAQRVSESCVGLFAQAPPASERVLLTLLRNDRSARRALVLRYILDHPGATMQEISTSTRTPLSTTSGHLSFLERVGAIERRRARFPKDPDRFHPGGSS